MTAAGYRDKLAAMRRSGAVVARALELCKELVEPGRRTGEIDARVEELIRSAGARPSFKGYNGFPASVCISINEQVVHGIPCERRLEEGEIVSLDVGAFLGGYHGDAALTIGVGEISDEARRLMLVTYQCLEAAVAQSRPGNRIGDIGAAVQGWAEEAGYQVVRDFTGHGIGRKLHERPQVPNFGRPGTGYRLRPGDAVAIEPMVNAGTLAVKVLPDNWTVVTYDGSLSAHYERTVFITDEGCEITTPWSWRGVLD